MFSIARYGGWAAKGLRVTWNCPVVDTFPLPALYLETWRYYLDAWGFEVSGCSCGPSRDPVQVFGWEASLGGVRSSTR